MASSHTSFCCCRRKSSRKTRRKNSCRSRRRTKRRMSRRRNRKRMKRKQMQTKTQKKRKKMRMTPKRQRNRRLAERPSRGRAKVKEKVRAKQARAARAQIWMMKTVTKTMMKRMKTPHLQKAKGTSRALQRGKAKAQGRELETCQQCQPSIHLRTSLITSRLSQRRCHLQLQYACCSVSRQGKGKALAADDDDESEEDDSDAADAVVSDLFCLRKLVQQCSFPFGRRHPQTFLFAHRQNWTSDAFEASKGKSKGKRRSTHSISCSLPVRLPC